jgi:hypothetical protein
MSTVTWNRLRSQAYKRKSNLRLRDIRGLRPRENKSRMQSEFASPIVALLREGAARKVCCASMDPQFIGRHGTLSRLEAGKEDARTMLA